MCWKKLKGLFRSKMDKGQPPEPALTQVKESRYDRWLKRHPKMKLVSTSRGGPNMPQYQPCPLGHGWKKRKGKTMAGALYWCNICKAEFFVLCRYRR